MNKVFKWSLIIVGVLIIIAIAGLKIGKYQTKKYSPEQTVTFKENGYDIKITYSSPFKKDRHIFGGLVPYGEVWRTGANEPTNFKTSTNLKIQGQLLPAGEYTLWTIPHPEEWEIIFNAGHPNWGIDVTQKASRKPEFDVVNANVQPIKNSEIIEQFTIGVEGNPPHLILAWDDIHTDLPFEHKN